MGIPLLLVATTFSSFGTGTLRPVLTSLITKATDRGEQGVVLGLTQSLNSIAAILAPIAGGFLIGAGISRSLGRGGRRRRPGGTVWWANDSASAAPGRTARAQNLIIASGVGRSGRKRAQGLGATVVPPGREEAVDQIVEPGAPPQRDQDEVERIGQGPGSQRCG